MKGLDHLIYFSSTSDSSGTATVTMTFAQGTNPDTAQVQVQNKLQSATALLPVEVQQQGLVVAKSARNFALIVGLESVDGSHRPGRSRRLHRLQDRRPAEPHHRRRRHPVLRLPVRHADLARPDQDGEPADHRRRRHQRGYGAERPGVGRPDRRPADGQGPAAQRHRRRAVAPADAGAVPPDPAAHQSRRLGGQARRRRARRAGRRNRGLHLALQRPSGHRPGDQAGARRQRAGDHQGGQGARWRSCRPSLPPDIKVVYPIDTSPFITLSIKDVVDHPGRGGGAGVPGDAGVPAELARDADPDHRRAGGAAGQPSRCSTPPASPSTP